MTAAEHLVWRGFQAIARASQKLVDAGHGLAVPACGRHFGVQQIAGAIHGGKALQLVLGHIVAGVDHAQRPQQVFVQIHIEGLTAENLDQVGHHVVGDAVAPGGAGLVGQGQLQQVVHKIRQRLVQY